MKKKILIGSMLVLTLLLLMPSIPAVQQKTIEDKAYSDFIEELKNVDLEDIEVLDDDVIFPRLLLFVESIYKFRTFRCMLLYLISVTFDSWGNPDEVILPLVFFRAMWLSDTAYLWCFFGILFRIH